MSTTEKGLIAQIAKEIVVALIAGGAFTSGSSPERAEKAAAAFATLYDMVAAKTADTTP